MQYQSHSAKERLSPFLMLGISIALMILFFFLLIKVIFWGILIGFVLFGLSLLRGLFVSKPKSRGPKIIEHDQI